MRGLWLFVISVILLFVGLVVACIAAFGAFGKAGLLVGVAVLLLFWIVAEIATSILYFTCAKLACEDRSNNG